MNDRYLDKEQKFYNYRTAEIEGLNIFDVNKASNSWAQNFLDDPNYMLKSENSVMNIVHMTPAEYWKICARDVFNKPVDQLMNQWRTLDEKTLDHLTQVILKYKKRFPITYINYASHNHPTQEGLHRMIVAGDLFGWDTKFPVMVIKWADEEKAAQEKENKRKNEVENNISKAIDKALRYKYYNIDELKDQLYSEIQDELKYDDEFENRSFTLDLVDSGDITNPGLLVIVDNKYECFIDYDDIQLQEKSSYNTLDSYTDLDDLIIDNNSEEWLNSYLNESQSADSTINFLTSSALINELKTKFGSNFYNKPVCKHVCEYIANRCDRCEALKFEIGVWKLSGDDIEPISIKGHCVIRYQDKLYDFTSGQYSQYGISEGELPRILEYDSTLSKIYNIDIYRDNDYIITVL